MAHKAGKQIRKQHVTASKKKTNETSKTDTPVFRYPDHLDTWAGLVRYLGEDCGLLDCEPLYAMAMQLIDLVTKGFPGLLGDETIRQNRQRRAGDRDRVTLVVNRRYGKVCRIC